MATGTATLQANYINGEWLAGSSSNVIDIINPATQESIAQIALAEEADTNAAVAAASAAFPGWRTTPPQDRIQYMFAFRELLLKHADEIAAITTKENGKTFAESRAELARGIENVEVSCGIPTLMQGYNLEDVARGIDEMMIRQPLGVTAAITPFNFPAMIPLWFMPYAIATGNTFILKPSERVPLTAKLIFELLQQTGLPKGVANLVVGAKPAVDTLLHHPDVRAISFVGSTPVAKYIYSEGSAHGKRVQCQGGAKNYVVVMPDADMDMTAKIISDSAFGCAGQRCLAISVAVTVADSAKKFNEALLKIASNIKTGNGLEKETTMGPVITAESKSRILHLIEKGVDAGGKVLLDGREGLGNNGNFITPTVLSGIDESNPLTTTEIFGPVLTVNETHTLDDAIETLSKSKFGNSAAIFTSSGAAARKFRYEVPTGNIGINIGVAAPMAYFPFSGWRDSFMGVLHGQGKDAIEFYTDKKVVIERWPKEWSRQF
ncbi:CoA-acylating methylmalonate-semialdehyde dehydrogenase [Granulicella sp. WH15]|uniref:CoA-acylating methylmalonate-semialdehyde dehydrogenase n=1 Tax=Granulicella sp. WH15 TaxID=2602070 RepID=UPI0013676734|nr:CoA-acylating methylmalonate-semialdehyde dehydrogenase [Granulicella sp. WH15]QHN04210.1 CoA-acylating methylmalonate-semialdehyde dehydrogenase [Granulicella sp. WH15]